MKKINIELFNENNKIEICNRPFANNYEEVPLLLNKNTERYLLDANGKKIKLKKNEIKGDKYCNREVYICKDNYLKYKDDDEYVYKLLFNNENNKIINNKICKFRMADTDINSLYGISQNENEFKNILFDKNKLIPDLINLNIYSQEDKEIMKNKINLYKIFIKTNEINGLGLNIWDLNGFLGIRQLCANQNHLFSETLDNKKNNIIMSFTDNNNNIIKKYGYGFRYIPRSYYELVNYANSNNLHVALAISKKVDRYACGIGKTKAIACDIAIARCDTFISLENIINNYPNLEDELRTEIKNKMNLYPIKGFFGNIIDCERGFNELDSNNDKLNYKMILDNYVNSKNSNTLAVLFYRCHSHKDIYNIIKNIKNNTINYDGSINGVYNKLIKKVIDEKDNSSGILMIDNERYMNFSDNIDNIIKKCNLRNNLEVCNKNDKICNDVNVIGYKDEKCYIYPNYKKIFENWDNFKNVPKTERNEIINNNKVNVAKETIELCKKTGSECLLYKLDNKKYCYDSLDN